MSDCQASRAVFCPSLIFFALFPHRGAISLTRYTVAFSSPGRLVLGMGLGKVVLHVVILPTRIYHGEYCCGSENLTSKEKSKLDWCLP